MKWFRMYVEAVDDEKLRLLAFEDRWHFVALLCCKGAGILDRKDHLTRRKVALKLGLSEREIDEVARRLAEVGLIDQETLEPLAWAHRQYESDTSTERVREYRKRMKRFGNVSETAQETETESETETEKKRARPRVARPPSVPEQVWNDWLAVRKQKKKPLTPTAWAAMERQASKAGIPIERAVEICAAKGWQGFVASYSWQDDEPAKPASQKPRDVWWTSDAAITAKAREVGIPESRWPATYAELKNIVFERLKSMEAA